MIRITSFAKKSDHASRFFVLTEAYAASPRPSGTGGPLFVFERGSRGTGRSEEKIPGRNNSKLNAFDGRRETGTGQISPGNRRLKFDDYWKRGTGQISPGNRRLEFDDGRNWEAASGARTTSRGLRTARRAIGSHSNRLSANKQIKN